MNVNKAIVVGRVTREPEMRTTPGGQNVTSFGVATNRVYNDAKGQKQEQTEFHNIVAWGKLAEICSQYLVIGQEIYVEGRMQARNWDAPDGCKRNRTEIVCENMQMGSKPRGFAPGAPASEQSAPASATGGSAYGGNNSSAPAPSAPSTEEINVEEIPF